MIDFREVHGAAWRAMPKKKGPQKAMEGWKVALAILRRHGAVFRQASQPKPRDAGQGAVFTRDLAGSGAVDGDQRRAEHLRLLPLWKI